MLRAVMKRHRWTEGFPRLKSTANERVPPIESTTTCPRPGCAFKSEDIRYGLTWRGMGSAGLICTRHVTHEWMFTKKYGRGVSGVQRTYGQSMWYTYDTDGLGDSWSWIQSVLLYRSTDWITVIYSNTRRPSSQPIPLFR